MASLKFRILATKPKLKLAIGSIIIRLFQRTKFSHFAIESINDNMIIDSKPEGTKWRTIADFYSKNIIIESWYFEIKEDKSIKQWSMNYHNSRYSFLQNIGAGLVWIGWLKTNPFGKDEKQLNCSELIVLWCRDFLGQEIGDSDQWDLVKTKKMLNSLKNSLQSKENK